MSESATEDAMSSSGATPDAEQEPASSSPSSGGGPGTEDLGESARRAIAALRREMRTSTERLTAERDALAARIEEYESANDTEAEKLRSKLGRAEKDLADARAELSTRDRRDAAHVAATKAGIPDWWDRLQGDSPEELEADAIRIAERISPVRQSADFGAGARSAGNEPGMDSLIRRRAGR